jgi:asparagine synthase (glutamine-hydrolysing)
VLAVAWHHDDAPGAKGTPESRIHDVTAIVGLFGDFAREGEAAARRVLRSMHARGSEHVEVWSDAGVTLGAVSDRWEIGDGAIAARVAWNEDAAVATDATLYYLRDLRAALERAGVPLSDASDASPARLILAAYRAWGRECLAYLEGDFALVLWDRRARTVLAARDHTGGRPLFFTRRPTGLALASRLDGLTSLPGFDAALNLLAIADDALFLRVQNPEGTAYRNAQRLPAGHRLDWAFATPSPPVVTRWWEVPVFLRGDGPPFEEAVGQLRRLIIDAVAEQGTHPGRSSIWLSGGYDSSALFAASQIAGAQRGAMVAHPVSMSHPPGDPGREDEFIEATTSFWRVTPTWVAVGDVPPLVDPIEGARLRDEPMYHTYEQSNRTLARATRAAGYRVALVGNGGDQFFSAGVARLADHFLRGNVITLAREWREAGGGNDWRLFVRHVVLPNLPAPAVTVIERQSTISLRVL